MEDWVLESMTNYEIRVFHILPSSLPSWHLPSHFLLSCLFHLPGTQGRGEMGPWLVPMLLHLKAVSPPEAEAIPGGQECPSNSTKSSDGLRHTAKALRGGKAVGLKWKNPDSSFSGLSEEGQPAASSPMCLQAPAWLEKEGGELVVVLLRDGVGRWNQVPYSSTPSEVSGLTCSSHGSRVTEAWPSRRLLPQLLYRACSHPVTGVHCPKSHQLLGFFMRASIGGEAYTHTTLTHLWALLPNSHFIRLLVW